MHKPFKRAVMGVGATHSYVEREGRGLYELIDKLTVKVYIIG